MQDFTQDEVFLLKEHLQEILITDSQHGTGFTIELILKDNPKQTFPDFMSLAEALECSLWLGELACLPDEKVKVNVRAIHANRSNDIHARKASNQFIKQGYGPRNPLLKGSE